MHKYSYDGGLVTARVIAMTQPLPEFAASIGLLDADGFNARDLVAYCARVSSPANQANLDTADKLLAYLVRNKHWSPFEMVNVVLDIELPRDIGRQLLRHKSLGFQEFSQRYAAVGEGSFKTREARLQDEKNRQNSVMLADGMTSLQEEWEQLQHRVLAEAYNAYSWALEHGIAKECARVVLPEGLTMSHVYFNGTVRSLIHYLELRQGNGTQLEHRALAYCIAYAVNETFGNLPFTFDEGEAADVVRGRISVER